jgi:hypothetical protein
MIVDYSIAARILLGGITILIGLGIFDVWRSTRAPQFVVGLVLIYYFSLVGAWKVISLRESGRPDPSVDHLEASLFPLNVDSNYLLTIALYGVFILAVIVTLRITARPQVPITSYRTPAFGLPDISHGLIFLMSSLALGASMFLVWDAISSALETGASAYETSRHDSNPFVAIHQLLNRIGLYSLAIGLAMAAARKPMSIAAAAYVPLISVWIAFLAVLGNRNELLIAIIAGTFVFYAAGGRIGKGWLFVLGFVGFVLFRLIEYLRGIGVDALTTGITGVMSTPQFWNPLALASGTESVAAHMSLYGIVSKDIDFTFGSSILYFVNSLIPRILLPDRIADSYTIYATAVSAPSDQGFTIHFAAGCYLNFGVVGIVVGGVTLALSWAAVFRLMCARRLQQEQRSFPALVAYCFCSAFIPVGMRSGPEGFKGLLIEGILLPFLIATMAACWRGLWRKRSSCAA